jgi:hypothetical protein
MTCAVSERLRCEALIYQGYVDGNHRCGRRATRLREGRQVCWTHAQPFVKARYVDDWFRSGRHLFGHTMARALGDDDSMSPLSTAYTDMIARAIERQAIGA